MADNKKSFILYSDIKDTFNALSDDEAGKLIKMILAFVNDEDYETDNRIIKILFEPIKAQLIRDYDKWINKVEKRKKSGSLGGLAKANKLKQNVANAKSANQNVTNLADNDNDNDNVSVNVNDNVNVSDINNISLDFEVLDEFNFDLFWDLYDKKTGKETCIKLYNKLSKEDKEKIFNHIPLYKEARPDKQYRKDPQTYLRNKTWNDEVILPQEKNNPRNFYNNLIDLKYEYESNQSDSKKFGEV